jgi:predicted PurR-regulated permease PerM
MDANAGAHKGTIGVADRLAGAFRAVRAGRDVDEEGAGRAGSASVVRPEHTPSGETNVGLRPDSAAAAEERLDLHALLELGEGENLNPQDVVDEIHSAAEIEAGVSDEQEYGRLGQRFDRRSPFYIGLTAAIGAAVAAALAWIVVAASQILVLLVLALFIAVGLDPAVAWLHRRGVPRWLAVSLVLACALGIFAVFVALAVPVLVTQAGNLATEIPHYLRALKNHNTTLGKLNARFHIVASLQKLFRGGAYATLSRGALGVGKVVLDALTAAVVVAIVSIYLLCDLPRLKRAIYQIAPRTRRARMVLLTDEILNRVGGYVLGNLLTSFIAGFGTWAWAMIFGIPYALLLGLLVALLDLVPIVGSTIGGAIVALVALTVSLPVAIATVIFYVVYRFLEDYLLTPRVMARTVAVPGLLTVIATLLGAALLGIIGALVAIPVAAGLKLLLEEITIPRLDRT